MSEYIYISHYRPNKVSWWGSLEGSIFSYYVFEDVWVTSYQLPIVKSMTGQVALRETSRVGLADFLAQSMAVEFDVLILDAERELELYIRGRWPI